jgi:hypothetical protein
VHFKRKLAIATTALAAAAFAGGAYAANQDSPGVQRQAFLKDAAKRLNVTPAELSAALKGAFQDQLNAAVKAGKLTQAQADALSKRFQNGGIGPMGFGHPGFFGGPRHGGPGYFGGPGPGPGGPGLGGPPGPGGAGPNRPLRNAAPLAAAARYLGLTDSQLFTQLRSGKTLAGLATAHGKSVSGLEQAITAAAKAELDKAVANKRITSAQEQKALSRLAARIRNVVSGTRPRFGPRSWFGHRQGAGQARGQAPSPGSAHSGSLPGALFQPAAPAGPPA